MPDDERYDGHPARRWKSYALSSSQLDDSPQHRSIYVAHGGAEPDILSVEHFVLEALRQQPSRPLRYVVVEAAGHGFETTDGKSNIVAVLRDFFRWSLGKAETSVHVMR